MDPSDTPKIMDASRYRIETFAPHVRSTFVAELSPDERLTMVLVEVKPGPAHPKVQQFSLFFRGPREPRLPQRIYRLHHAELETIDLFLVPVDQTEEGMMYEAVFSRFLDPAAKQR